MVINLTPQQESLILDAAKHEGISVEQVVLDAVLRFAQDEAADRDSIERGLAQADRGEFIDEAEMARRFARMLQR